MWMPPSLSASPQEVSRKVLQRFPISAYWTDFTFNAAASFNFHRGMQVYTLWRPASMVGAL
jgi:hypothetical protein